MNKPLRPMTFANGGIAPVCPTSRSQFPAAQPMSRAVPIATDLPSAIRAINQLIIMMETPKWQEIHRVVTPVRIFNPNDSSQWVDVERIASLTFQDQTTGGLWNWKY